MIKLSNLRGDIFGGITAAVVALPLALAFGIQSGLGAEAGLYGAIALGFFASLLGSCRTQISGPTGPMTVVAAVLIATLISQIGSLPAAMPYIVATILLAGFLQIGFALIKLGQYIKYIPYPVISGFMSGIGVIIIILQLFPMLGYPSPTKIIDILVSLPQQIPQTNLYALAVTLSTLAVIYIAPRFTKLIPGALLALIVITLANYFLQLPVPVIGDIPTGLPDLRLGDLLAIDYQHLHLIMIPAVTLAALGSIDTLLTSIVADNLTKTRHNSNRELFGQGVGNMVAGAIGGLPGAGATMRTVVNIRAGGHSQLSGIIHAVLLLTILLGLGAYVQYVPTPVLAGILITVGISIIDAKGFRHIRHIPRADALVMVTVLLLTVFVDLLQAVAVGVILACVLFMKKMGDLTEEKTAVKALANYDADNIWPNDEKALDGLGNKVFVKHIEGPLFFGFTSQFRVLTEQIPEVKAVIIRMELVPYIDQSGLYALEDSILYLANKQIKVYLTGLESQSRVLMENIGLIPNLVPPAHIYSKFRDCITHLKQTLQ